MFRLEFISFFSKYDLWLNYVAYNQQAHYEYDASVLKQNYVVWSNLINFVL
jgi:hypothetical protein